MGALIDPRAATFRKIATVCLLCVILMLSLSGSAWAEEGTTTTDEAAAVEETPALDYSFTWPTFILCIGLVIGYYIFVLRISEKEFKGVVAERFGPKRLEEEGTS